ncbi:unnamed protein product [Effrenium voratum]|nr:unnamed protein product [Effrenium voratum]
MGSLDKEIQSFRSSSASLPSLPSQPSSPATSFSPASGGLSLEALLRRDWHQHFWAPSGRASASTGCKFSARQPHKGLHCYELISMLLNPTLPMDGKNLNQKWLTTRKVKVKSCNLNSQGESEVMQPQLAG